MSLASKIFNKEVSSSHKRKTMSFNEQNVKDKSSSPTKILEQTNSKINDKYARIKHKYGGVDMNESKDKVSADMGTTYHSGTKISSLSGRKSRKSTDLKGTTSMDFCKMDLPKNINSFKQLYDTHKLHDQDIYWVLNLRQHELHNHKSFSLFEDDKEEKTLQEKPPRFFEEDLHRFISRKKSQNPREVERQIFLPKNENNLFYNHLINKRLGTQSNQTQLSFETTLRNLPDLTIPSGKYSQKYRNGNFVNKHFNPAPYNQMAQTLYPSYLKPINEKFIKNVNKQSEKVVRPINYTIKKVAYDEKNHIYKKSAEYIQDQTIPFLGEHNSQQSYNEKFGRSVYFNNFKNTSCHNSYQHFEQSLRNDGEQEKFLKSLKNPKPYTNTKKKSMDNLSIKKKFWFSSAPPRNFDEIMKDQNVKEKKTEDK